MSTLFKSRETRSPRRSKQSDRGWSYDGLAMRYLGDEQQAAPVDELLAAPAAAVPAPAAPVESAADIWASLQLQSAGQSAAV